MANDEGQTEREEFRGAPIQILGTNPDDPEEGRIFVLMKTGLAPNVWKDSGAMLLLHPSRSWSKNLRELISRDNPQADATELGGEFRKKVSEEFDTTFLPLIRILLKIRVERY